jgi:hypothetical protein
MMGWFIHRLARLRSSQSWTEAAPPAQQPSAADDTVDAPTVGSTGMLAGRHFTGWFELLEGLHGSRQTAAYERLLLDCIASAESEADERHALALAELYFRLAQVYRRRGDVEAEHALLVWWTGHPHVTLPVTTATLARLEHLRRRHAS